MILVWRMLTKVLRRVGRWALLVPTAVMGVALFALNIWTAATVLFALLLAVLLALTLVGQRPRGNSSLLPVAMLSAGICGLWAAATTAGSWVKGANVWSVFTGVPRFVPKPGMPGAFKNASTPLPQPVWFTKGGVEHWPAVFPGVTGQVTIDLRNGQQLSPQMQAKQMQVNFYARNGGPPGKGVSVSIAGGPRGSRTIIRGPGGPGGGRVTQVLINGHGLMWGRLLILGSLLLLALGLWLAPRAMSDLRAQYTKVAPGVKQWLQEGNWGVLLVPVTCFGLTMFGVRPWTVAAIIAAVVLTIRWPKVAGDLVPLLLVGFALYGFLLASRWMPGPSGPGPLPHATWFGAVPVDSSHTSLLAGVEASMLLAFGAWLFPRTIGVHAHGKTASGQAELAGRVQRLTETRNQAVDAAAAELRRIERDLHDGTQARLVALGMNLRALERMLPASSPGALALVAEARETSLRALTDLRHLVRGIYPPVLADRGLAHAVQALALDTPLPVEVDIDLPGRLAPPVESACYFAVAEVLANAVKHSGAHHVHIRIQHAAGVLRMEVADDGTGGADPAAGTGLRGVERRLGTFDGIVAVNSPTGGPTMIAMEVPCELSSRKIYSSLEMD